MERHARRHGVRRVVAVTVLAGAFILGTAASAFAITGNGPVSISTTGASFSGNIYWYANGVNHGGMDVYGNLKDTLADSNSVYMKGRVSGYSYTTLWNNYNGAGSTVYGDKVVYDPQATMVSYGYISVCRNGILDNCYEQYEHR